MPEMILGIDIGTETVKAVLAVPRGRTDVRVSAREVVRFEGTGDLEAVLKKIAEAIAPQASSRPHCVVTLPPADIMFRQLNLPFKDENKIKKTLPFELEPLLPVPVEEVVADYMPLPGEGLLAAACGRERIHKVLALVEKYLGDVSGIDISAAALALPLLEQKSADAGILLDIGASSTVAVFYENNAIVQIRSLAFGGNAVTNALAEDVSRETTEAEKIKRDGAYGGNIDRAENACQEFCIALANTVEFLMLNETLHKTVSTLTVTGGGALFKPLMARLEKTFGRPVDVLDFSRFCHLELAQSLSADFQPLMMNTALAAVRRALASRKSFNFRQGEFAAKNLLEGFRTQLKWAAIAAGILLALAAADLVLDYQLQSRKVSSLKSQISAIFKKHFSPTAVMVDPAAQLKAKLTEERKTYGLDGGASGTPVIQLLKDISGGIPSTLDVVITHFHYENNMILLKGEAKKVDDITAVKNGLAKSPHFKTVTLGTTSLGKEGAKVNFDLKVELK